MARRVEQDVTFTSVPVENSFNPPDFDDKLRNHGVRLIHYRALRCPVGMVDRDSERRPHPDHSGCSNGHIYSKSGIVTGLFTSNSNRMQQMDAGMMDGGTAQVTLPPHYDDCDAEVQVAPYDRLYLDEEAITVPHHQLKEAHITGRDRLSRPAVKITDLIDSNGKVYGPDDFSLVDGQIVWANGGPGYDVEKKMGVIYSVRYTYRPYFYVDRMIHQIRIAQVNVGRGRAVVRMPQSMSVIREYVFEAESNDRKAPNPDSPRQVPSAGNDIFGER